MAPIATYRESSPGLRRKLTLYFDHVTVYAKTLGGHERESHIPLDEISPNVGYARFRVRRWLQGMLLGSFLGLFIWIFVGEFNLPWTSPRVLTTAVLCFMSFAWGAYYLRRYRVFQFVNRSGIVVLDVIESGPEKDRCADFVALIEQTIRDTSGLSKDREQTDEPEPE